LDEWIYFLKHDSVKEGFRAKGLIRASEILDYSRLTKEEKSEYDYLHEQKSRYRSEMFTLKFTLENKYSKIIGEKEKALEEKEKALEEKDKALEEKDKALEEKDKALEEERKMREEKDKALEAQRKELEELKRRYNIE
jgi:chromosome segregation ATPase